MNEEIIKEVVLLTPVDSDRVKEIVKMLPDNPKGFGDPIEKRVD